MSKTTKEILLAISEMQKAIDSLIAINQQETSPTDADLDFAVAGVISKRNYLKALEAQGMLFKDGKDNEITAYLRDYFYKYKLPTIANIPMRYWWEINDFVNWFNVELDFYSGNQRQDEELDEVKRNAMLWDNVCLVKTDIKIKKSRIEEQEFNNDVEETAEAEETNNDTENKSEQYDEKNSMTETPSNKSDDEVDNKKSTGDERNDREADNGTQSSEETPQKVQETYLWRCERIVKREGNKVWTTPLLFNAEYTQSEPAKDDESKKEHTVDEDCVVFNIFFDNIGMYVKAIPYMGIWLYFRSLKEKGISFINIIPDTTLAGNSKLSWLTDPDVFEVKNKTYDSQNPRTQADNLGAKVKWLQPEGDIQSLFNLLNFEIEKIYELMCSKFGRTVKAVDDRQTLSSEANIYASSYIGMMKLIMKNFFRSVNKAIELGADITNGEPKEVWKANERQQAQGNDNDNASGGATSAQVRVSNERRRVMEGGTR